jgi:hypothetical protein
VLEAGYRSTICGGKESDVDEVEFEWKPVGKEGRDELASS